MCENFSAHDITLLQMIFEGLSTLNFSEPLSTSKIDPKSKNGNTMEKEIAPPNKLLTLLSLPTLLTMQYTAYTVHGTHANIISLLWLQCLKNKAQKGIDSFMELEQRTGRDVTGRDG